MLRVLTLATLFPNGAQPGLGLFVERQTIGLAALPDAEVQIVSPVGLPPWPLSLHSHYALRSGLPEREERNGLIVHRPRYRAWPRLGRRLDAKSMARALLPMLRGLRREFPFDVIDAEFFWPDGPAAIAIARALDLPFSIKARGSDIQRWGARPGTSAQIVAAGRGADGLLAVSGALKARMEALGMPGERIRVHHTGVDHGLFRPVDRAAAKSAMGIEGPLLVTVGWLIPGKGQRLTIAALEHMPDATLLIAGEGPDRASLGAFARDRGLEARVRFLGPVAPPELARLLAAADAMVLPSESEGLANVWVEALACGTPIVIADVGGAREVVDRPEAGRIAAREPGAIAEAVTALLADPPAQEDVRKAAERFSWERNGRELFEHLSDLVNGRRSPSTIAFGDGPPPRTGED
jgi:teichuronic acid biosynthesis glycosyltransferase TuaC